MVCRGVLVAVEEKEKITINKIEEWWFDEPFSSTPPTSSAQKLDQEERSAVHVE